MAAQKPSTDTLPFHLLKLSSIKTVLHIQIFFPPTCWLVEIHNKYITYFVFCFLCRLKGLLPQALDLRSDLPDEVLYGRSGFLLALLFVKHNVGEDAIENRAIQQVSSG